VHAAGSTQHALQQNLVCLNLHFLWFAHDLTPQESWDDGMMGPNAAIYAIGGSFALIITVQIIHYVLRRNRVIRYNQSASTTSIAAGVAAHLYRHAAGLDDESLRDDAQCSKIDADDIIRRYIKEKESGVIRPTEASGITPTQFGRKPFD
jgi:hypothetical protein